MGFDFEGIIDRIKLYECLKERYVLCKKHKFDQSNKQWAIWSGAFNKYRRELEDTNYLTHLQSHCIFGIWQAYNQLLQYNKKVFVSKKKVRLAKDLALRLKKDLFTDTYTPNHNLQGGIVDAVTRFRHKY